MRMKKGHYSKMLILFLVFVLAGCGERKDEKTLLDENVKVIRVIVKESYEKADKVKLPFFDVAKEILERYGGFLVVGEDAKTYDATLLIKARGIPLSAFYISSGWYYSGAKVKGELQLTAGRSTFKSTFSGKIDPPSTINRAYESPNDAPFKDAFDKDFYHGVIKLLGDLKGLGLLIAATLDKNGHVRQAAADVPEEIDPEWTKTEQAKVDVPMLISALKDRDANVREAAAEALSKIKDPRAVEPLIPVLKDEDSSVRKAAAEALGKITGQKFGVDYDAWQKWWEENKAKY